MHTRRSKTRTSSVHMMAYCCYYLNQCCPIVNWALWNKFQWILNLVKKIPFIFKKNNLKRKYCLQNGSHFHSESDPKVRMCNLVALYCWVSIQRDNKVHVSNSKTATVKITNVHNTSQCTYTWYIYDISSVYIEVLWINGFTGKLWEWGMTSFCHAMISYLHVLMIISLDHMQIVCYVWISMTLTKGSWWSIFDSYDQIRKNFQWYNISVI